jgi:four helix bundle suffix protein
MPDDRTKETHTTKKRGANHSSSLSSASYPGFIPPHGGYDNLIAYRKSQIIYDGTVRFCDRFIDKKSRTHDQMVQAARSGNKNIAEGSQISGTSKESELKLTGVARGSLEELLGDYRDYLRQHEFREWNKNDREALYVRKLGARNEERYEDYRAFIETRPAEVVANILICLIHQANYLLDQQLRRLEQEFLQAGGLRERMTRARLAARAAEIGNRPPKPPSR